MSALERFALWVLDEMRDGLDLDGFAVQDEAVRLGVLVQFTATGPCGGPDGPCVCAEVGDFPTTCFRESDETTAARKQEG